jgi:hypothetical protein
MSGRLVAAGLRGEAIHFDKHLVQCLLALVVTLAHPRAALAADGVELVYEDDRGRLVARLAEEVSHPRCTHADQ